MIEPGQYPKCDTPGPWWKVLVWAVVIFGVFFALAWLVAGCRATGAVSSSKSQVPSRTLPAAFSAIARSQAINPVTGEICITNPFSRPPGKVLCYTPDTNPPVPVPNFATINIPWPKTAVDVWLLYSTNSSLPFSNWGRILVISSNWAVNPRGVLPTPFYHFTDCTTNAQRYYALLYNSK